jgi:PTS system mannose-specific IID component
VLQGILDQVLPGLLPLAVVMGVYFYFSKKGLKITQALLGLSVILAVLGAIWVL